MTFESWLNFLLTHRGQLHQSFAQKTLRCYGIQGQVLCVVERGCKGVKPVH